MIRKWWAETEKGRGLLVWEYYLRGCYVDAVWFPEHSECGEHSGPEAARNHPIAGKRIFICEAKIQLTPELIGQALVYASFARREAADVLGVTIFAESGSHHLQLAARDFGLRVVMPDASADGA